MSGTQVEHGSGKSECDKTVHQKAKEEGVPFDTLRASLPDDLYLRSGQVSNLLTGNSFLSLSRAHKNCISKKLTEAAKVEMVTFLTLRGMKFWEAPRPPFL